MVRGPEMNINKINNTNFKAIYKIPYSERTLNEIRQQILPNYCAISNQKAGLFVGRNPFFDGLKIWINAIAKQNNSSVEWLKMNARNHGGKVEYIEEGFIHVMTGEKDIDAISNYMKEKTNDTVEKIKQLAKEKSSIWYKIKKFFVGEKEPERGYDENTPEHLKLLFQLIKQNKEQTEIFNAAFPKIIEVKTEKELCIKMLNER